MSDAALYHVIRWSVEKMGDKVQLLVEKAQTVEHHGSIR